MNFEDWMLHKSLSASTALKYDGAIKGSLTEWGMDNGLLEGPLTSIRSQTQFESIAKKIRELPISRVQRARSQHVQQRAAEVRGVSLGRIEVISSRISTRSFPTRTSLQLRRVASSKRGSVKGRSGSA